MTGALRVVVLLLTVASSALAILSEICTNDDQFECAGDEVICDPTSGKCRCLGDYQGKHFLGCHPPGYDVCCIFNDPRGKTFGREPAGGLDIPVPCKYLIAHICTDHDGVQCNYTIFTAEERLQGKFFISGFEIQLEYSVDGGMTIQHFHARAYVDRSSGSFTYVRQTRDVPGGSYGAVDVTAIEGILGTLAVTFEADEDKINRVHFTIDKCGVEMYFRAAEEGLGKNQTQMAGLTLGVDSDKSPNYKSLDEAFCLTSDKDELTVGDVTNELNMMETHAFMYRALIGNYDQDFPNTPQAQCESIKQQLAPNCTDSARRLKAFEQCDFIFNHPHFVNCYAASADSEFLVALMEDCLLAFCQEDDALCLDVHNDITYSGCKSKAPVEFTGFDCDFDTA